MKLSSQAFSPEMWLCALRNAIWNKLFQSTRIANDPVVVPSKDKAVENVIIQK